MNRHLRNFFRVEEKMDSRSTLCYAVSRAREIRDAQLWDRQKYSGRKVGDLCEFVNHEKAKP